MNFDWSTLSEEQAKYYVDLCPINEYRVLCGEINLPGISPGLTKKADTFLIACSGDGKGTTFYMANINRKDKKDEAIDQNPFGFLLQTGDLPMTAALIQHGDWDGRTVAPSCSAWQEILSGNYSQYETLEILPKNNSGTIFELDKSSNINAFSTLISGLNKKISQAPANEQKKSPEIIEIKDGETELN